MHVDQPIGKPYAFGLCRIEPENNVHIILEAFSKHGEQLIFVGNWNNSEYGKDLYKRFSNMKNILLLDPIYCIDSLYNYRNNCLFYVHGHSAGGTNPSLVEMMHFGKLIVAYDCIFNRNTMENHGIYFDTVESLYQRLSLSIDGSDGEALLQVAKRRYMWRTVREQYINLF
jgi:glycosyltransferase involved in cell wall biosynthesis